VDERAREADAIGGKGQNNKPLADGRGTGRKREARHRSILAVMVMHLNAEMLRLVACINR